MKTEKEKKEYQRRYYKKNKKRIIKRIMRRREKRKDEYLEYQRKYQKENRKKLNKYQHEYYYEKNKKKTINYHKNYYRKNKEAFLKRGRKQKHIEFLMKKYKEEFYATLEDSRILLQTRMISRKEYEERILIIANKYRKKLGLPELGKDWRIKKMIPKNIDEVPPAGSAGWCATCKHKFYCQGSTENTGMTRQEKCNGFSIIYLLNGNEIRIEHETYAKEKKSKIRGKTFEHLEIYP